MALFKLEKKASRGPAGKWDVLVSEEMCKACGFCLAVCPVDVFAWRKVPNRLGWFPMYTAKEDNCIGCMLCYQICPDFCIDVTLKPELATGLSTRGLTAPTVGREGAPTANPKKGSI